MSGESDILSLPGAETHYGGHAGIDPDGCGDSFTLTPVPGGFKLSFAGLYLTGRNVNLPPIPVQYGRQAVGLSKDAGAGAVFNPRPDAGGDTFSLLVVGQPNVVAACTADDGGPPWLGRIVPDDSVGAQFHQHFSAPVQATISNIFDGASGVFLAMIPSTSASPLAGPNFVFDGGVSDVLSGLVFPSDPSSTSALLIAEPSRMYDFDYVEVQIGSPPSAYVSATAMWAITSLGFLERGFLLSMGGKYIGQNNTLPEFPIGRTTVVTTTSNPSQAGAFAPIVSPDGSTFALWLVGTPFALSYTSKMGIDIGSLQFKPATVYLPNLQPFQPGNASQLWRLADALVPNPAVISLALTASASVSKVVTSNAEYDFSGFNGFGAVVMDSLRMFKYRKTFDTSTKPGNNAFLEFMYDIDVGNQVNLVSVGNPFLGLTTEAIYAVASVGSALIWSATPGCSFAVTGLKGAPSGTVAEQVAPPGQTVSLSGQPPAPFSLGTVIDVQASQTSAFVLINDIPIGVLGRGLNVVAIDETTFRAVSTQTFDLSAAGCSAFAATIAALPVGRLVAVASFGDFSGVTQPAIDAMQNRLGSAAFAAPFLATDTFAFVGRTNAELGLCSESRAAGHPAHAMYFVRPPQPAVVANQGNASSYTLGAQSDSVAGCHVFVDGLEVTCAPNVDGMNVVVIDEPSGIVLSSRHFPTGTPDGGTNFRVFLEQVPMGRYVLVVSKGSAVAGLNDEAKRALGTCGALAIWSLTESASYSLIGRRGAAPGSALERMHPSAAVSLAFDVSRTSEVARPFTELFVRSQLPTPLSPSASIQINGQDVFASTDQRPGLRVAAISRSGNFLSSGIFDTSKDAGASAVFVTFVQQLPAETTVAIASAGNVSAMLSDAAKATIEALGSSRIRSLAAGGAFAFVGRVGAAARSASETVTASGATSTKSWIPRVALTGLDVDIRSLDTAVGNTADITVNTISVLPSPRRGINVVVLNEAAQGAVLNTVAFNTSADATASDALAQFVEGLPPGRIVLCAVMGDGATLLTDRARHALASLGSHRIWRLQANEAWALIGTKGASPGSVPETNFNSGPCMMESWVPVSVDPAHGPSRLFVFPLAWVFGAVVVAGISSIISIYSGLPADSTVTVTDTVLPPPDPFPAPPMLIKKRFLFIGIDYMKIGSLTLRDRDGAGLATQRILSLRTALVNKGAMELADTRMVLEAGGDTIPSKAAVLAEIKRLVTSVVSEGVTVVGIFFLGHGNVDKKVPGSFTATADAQSGLITLTPDLEGRDVLWANEFQAALFGADGIPPGTNVNVTCVFHCCYSGGMFESKPDKGCWLSSVTKLVPATLSARSNDLTGLMMRMIKRTTWNFDSNWMTLKQIFDYVRPDGTAGLSPPPVDIPTVWGKAPTYAPDVVKFLKPL